MSLLKARLCPRSRRGPLCFPSSQYTPVLHLHAEAPLKARTMVARAQTGPSRSRLESRLVALREKFSFSIYMWVQRLTVQKEVTQVK